MTKHNFARLAIQNIYIECKFHRPQDQSRTDRAIEIIIEAIDKSIENVRKEDKQLAEAADILAKNKEQNVIDNAIVKAATGGKALMSWVQQHQKLEQIEKILGSDDEDSDVVTKIMILMRENKDG